MSSYLRLLSNTSTRLASWVWAPWGPPGVWLILLFASDILLLSKALNLLLLSTSNCKLLHSYLQCRKRSRHSIFKVPTTRPETGNPLCKVGYYPEPSETGGTGGLFSPPAPFKGQLISKCLFGIFNSPKKRTKKFNFTTMVPQVDFFCSFFGRIEDTKKAFRNKVQLFRKDHKKLKKIYLLFWQISWFTK